MPVHCVVFLFFAPLRVEHLSRTFESLLCCKFPLLGLTHYGGATRWCWHRTFAVRKNPGQFAAIVADLYTQSTDVRIALASLWML